MCHPGQVSAKIKGLTGSNRPIYKLDLRSTVRSMIGNIEEAFLQKNWYVKKAGLEDPGYVDTVKTCCMQHCSHMRHPYVK